MKIAKGKDSVTPLSVIIVTHNPRQHLLDAALECISRQTLPKSDFDVVIVDNASDPALDEAALLGRGLNFRLIREPRLGITFARCAGITAASGGILVFVDDDNQLEATYLENALRIARGKADVGAFGGACLPLFESSVAPWKLGLLPYLGVRDHGPCAISSRSGDWGAWDPIGAGMVIRVEVGREFVRMIQASAASRRLGRAGAKLMSGEDTLLARTAWLLGYACSYEPELKLRHFIKSSRLTARVLAATLLGHGRSYVVLERLLGRPAGVIDWRTPIRLLCAFLSRVHTCGLRAGSIAWLWDLGRVLELCRTPSDTRVLTSSTAEDNENLYRRT